jgi:hypothetical protein
LSKLVLIWPLTSVRIFTFFAFGEGIVLSKQFCALMFTIASMLSLYFYNFLQCTRLLCQHRMQGPCPHWAYTLRRVQKGRGKS